MKRLSVLAAAVLLAACAADTGEDEQIGDVGETGQDLSVGVTCTHSNMATAACQQMRSAVLDGVSDADRKAVLERGFAWIDANVMYSQTSAYHGFRTDCSGFVSMAWQESVAYNTAGFAPFSTAVSKQLSGYSALLPGDALNKVPREHIFLFGAWADSAHDQMVILEESHTGAPAMMKVVASSYFDGFRAIRSDKLGSTNTGGTDTGDDSGDTTSNGSGSTSSGDTSGGATCYSATLGKNMPENACVQTASTGKWYQCDNGSWVARASDPMSCNGVYPD